MNEHEKAYVPQVGDSIQQTKMDPKIWVHCPSVLGARNQCLWGSKILIHNPRPFQHRKLGLPHGAPRGGPSPLQCRSAPERSNSSCPTPKTWVCLQEMWVGMPPIRGNHRGAAWFWGSQFLRQPNKSPRRSNLEP